MSINNTKFNSVDLDIQINSDRNSVTIKRKNSPEIQGEELGLDLKHKSIADALNQMREPFVVFFMPEISSEDELLIKNLILGSRNYTINNVLSQ